VVDLYFWTTPNAYKVLLFLEEAGLPYRLVPVNISRGEQFDPGFLAISPNNRIPAIVDHAPADAGAPVPVFESGAILQYLARKTGRFGGNDERQAVEVGQWLFWQMAGLGPMAGQNHHFNHYAPQPLPYAIDRYMNEVARLYGVLERRLRDRSFVAGEDYSIADMACYPWMILHQRGRQDMAAFPAIRAWLDRIAERPATGRAYARGQAVNQVPVVNDDDARRVLFGQSARLDVRQAGT